MNSATNVYAEAQRLLAARLAVLPIRADGTKKPAVDSWKTYQERLPTADEIRQWFANGRTLGLAVIAGSGSGNVLVIDFDQFDLFKPWRDAIRATAPGLYEQLVVTKTPGPGFQVWFKCQDPVGHNEKLAERQGIDAEGRPVWVTLIETRGEGGYAIVPPTPAACHRSGRPYEMVTGDLADLPLLGDLQVQILLTAAKAFNEREGRREPLKHRPAAAASDRPGDDYNQRGDWHELLTRHGWTADGTRGETEFWVRPGKDQREGHSATLHATAPGMFYVFSSNAHPFEPEKSYSLFSAYALLEHKGDFRAAAAALREKGYGKQPETTKRVEKPPPETETPGLARIEGFSAAELMRMDIAPARYPVPGYICEGLNIFASGQKQGKSFLAMGLGVAIATGGIALGEIQVERGEVLYLALEDGPRRLQDRLGKILGGDPAPAALHLYPKWPRAEEGGIAELRTWLSAHKRTRLVIIDTLGRFRSAKGNNSDVFQADYQFGASLKQIADDYHLALLILHHISKRATEDPFDAVSGTMALTASADATLVLKRQRGKNEALLFVTGRDVEEREMALEWSPELWTWRLAGTAEDHRMSQSRHEIREAILIAKRSLTPKEIADATGRNRNTIRVLVMKMANDGQLYMDKPDHYQVADGG